ncbi:MAG: hypothetical protein FWD49_05695 [Firmicutes bacterium]|nr:hypothetical protein [Bacillota bacterium]
MANAKVLPQAGSYILPNGMKIRSRLRLVKTRALHACEDATLVKTASPYYG